MRQEHPEPLHLFTWCMWAFRPVCDPPLTLPEVVEAAALTWERLSLEQQAWWQSQVDTYAAFLADPAPGERRLMVLPGGQGRP